mmetsp:Transcript_3489/g.5938  ORF Transcript_3489/g.5938 Transcript_3489/m.5938 type:complete len:202 (+) Transcript_3489:17-622(+)
MRLDYSLLSHCFYNCSLLPHRSPPRYPLPRCDYYSLLAGGGRNQLNLLLVFSDPLSATSVLSARVATSTVSHGLHLLQRCHLLEHVLLRHQVVVCCRQQGVLLLHGTLHGHAVIGIVAHVLVRIGRQAVQRRGSHVHVMGAIVAIVSVVALGGTARLGAPRGGAGGVEAARIEGPNTRNVRRDQAGDEVHGVGSLSRFSSH